MDLGRLLLQRHREELLVELRSPVQIGNPHRDMVDADGSKLCLFGRRLRSNQRGEGEGELAAGQCAALETAEHLFDGLYHKVLSKYVLQRELHLPHTPRNRSNLAESRAGESIVRQSPCRVIHDVKRFHTDLQLMTFFGHAEDFVRGEIPVQPGRTDDCVPACVAELINGLQDERRCVEPPLRSWISKGLALTAGVRTVIPNV